MIFQKKLTVSGVIALRRSVIWTAIILTAICFISVAACAQHCAPGAFLATNVNSVDDLVRQVTGNQVVAKRYSNYFDMTPDSISEYFRSNVKITKLQKPMKAKVHFIGKKTGRIYSKTKVLPAGTKVFTSLDGTPFMDQKCGNPFGHIRVPAKPVERVKPTEEKIIPPPKVEAFVPPPVAAEPPVEVAMLPLVAPAISAPPLPKASMPLGAAAPALLALGAVRHSSPPIPEPGTIIAAFSILVPAGILFRRRSN